MLPALIFAHYDMLPTDYCDYGHMRLVGGETEAEGRLELCNDGRWGTVCDNRWTDRHTAVVCRQLGFSDVIGGISIHNDTTPPFEIC